MKCAAEMLRRKALGFPLNVPAFGEVIWRSRDKKQARSAHIKGALGRLIGIDLQGDGAHHGSTVWSNKRMSPCSLYPLTIRDQGSYCRHA